MKVQLLSHTKDPELLIATAAKLCYSPSNIKDLMDAQSPERVDNFISRLEEMGHESPFEHVSFTFAIEGVSRVLEQQLTRHRIASYSIQSGRYVDRSNAAFYMPGDIEECEDAKDIYVSIIEHSKAAYTELTGELLYHYIVKHNIENNSVPEEKLVDTDTAIEYFKDKYGKEFNAMKKRAIENARFVFPSSLETKIIVTMNVRTLWNFFKHRRCFRAQDEIRECAGLMLNAVREVSPRLFKHAGPSCLSGICPEGSMQCEQLKGKIPTHEDVKELIKKYYKNGRVV